MQKITKILNIRCQPDQTQMNAQTDLKLEFYESS